MQQASITIPAGYYTLQQLSEIVGRQGIRIEAENACASDVYTVRLDHVSWSDVREALTADGRLVVTKDGSKWRINRSAAGKSSDDATLQKYLSMARASIHAVSDRAMNQCREMDALSPPQRESRAMEYASAKEADPDVQRADYLCYLEYENEFPFALIALTAKLTDPQQPAPFSQVETASAADWMSWLVPAGTIGAQTVLGADLKAMSDSQRAEFAKALRFSVKLSVDPLTLTCELRGFGYTSGLSTIVIYEPQIIAPNDVKIEITPSRLWNDKELAAMAERARQTEALLQSDPAKIDAELPDRPMRLSEILLRWADSAHQNLVCIAPSFSDYELSKLGHASLATILSTVNQGRLAPRWIAASIRERASDSVTTAKEALTPQSRVDAAMVKGVFVIRNELRFLDGLCVSGRDNLVDLDTQRIRNHVPKAEALMRHIADIDVNQWSTSLYSGQFLEYCDPVTLRPFGLAYLQSATLRRTLAGCGNNESVTLPYAQLEPEAKAALRKGMMESAFLNDSQPNLIVPDLIESIYRKAPESDLEIMIHREAGVYFLTFIWAGEPRWSSWVQNVDFGG